jgi:sulfate adenylyltransferase subunit 1/sulfate transport system substrate-binding protein
MFRLRQASIPVFLAAVLIGAVPGAARAQTLLNVSYDPTRELYKAINQAFADDWKAKTGATITMQSSHGGSGAQARSVIDGLPADVVTLALAADIDAIVRAGKIKPGWADRLPNNANPYTSTILFLVRKGNPKNIEDWDDLARSGVSVITPNPKTSGGARWNYLAAWGYAERKFDHNEAKVKDFVGAIYKNVPVLDSGARASTITFAQRGLGDVLIAWENDAFEAFDEFGKDQFEIVVPSLSILAEPPVAVVDANVDRKGTRAAAEAYLQFLYTPKAQAIIAQNYFRPFHPEYAAKQDLDRLPKVAMITIRDFGGWDKVQAEHFDDNGVFDQIFKPK